MALSRKFTNECEWLAWHAQSLVSVVLERVRDSRVMSRLLAYANSRVLYTQRLASTRKRTREYSKLSCRQHLITVGVAHNRASSPGLWMGINVPKHGEKWPVGGTGRYPPFLVGASCLSTKHRAPLQETNLTRGCSKILIINITCTRNSQR